jgi:hypothetical protein
MFRRNTVLESGGFFKSTCARLSSAFAVGKKSWFTREASVRTGQLWPLIRRVQNVLDGTQQRVHTKPHKMDGATLAAALSA